MLKNKIILEHFYLFNNFDNNYNNDNNNNMGNAFDKSNYLRQNVRNLLH